MVHRVHPGLSLDVSLRLGREIGVVFGPSGAGKTTLLRLIAGLTTPARGPCSSSRARPSSTPIARIDQPLRYRRIGMIFQDDCLFPHLNVAANIRFGLKGWPRAEADARLAEVAALCGVEHLLDAPPGNTLRRRAAARRAGPGPGAPAPAVTLR